MNTNDINTRSRADTGILKRGALRISDEGGPTIIGGDVPENFEN